MIPCFQEKPRSSQLGYHFGGSKCEATTQRDRRLVGDDRRAVEVKQIARVDRSMCKADGQVRNPKKVVLSKRFFREQEERQQRQGRDPKVAARRSC